MCSNSVPLISQKNTYLANQRRGPAGWLCRCLLTRSGFPHRSRQLLGTGRFYEKDSAKLRKSQAVTPAENYNIRRSIFTADLSKVYRKICIAVRDFYTVAGGERKLANLIILKLKIFLYFWNFPRCANLRCTGQATMSIECGDDWPAACFWTLGFF